MDLLMCRQISLHVDWDLLANTLRLVLIHWGGGAGETSFKSGEKQLSNRHKKKKNGNE